MSANVCQCQRVSARVAVMDALTHTAPGGWLTRHEAARRAGVDIRTIDRWLRCGRLPRYRTAGRAVRIREHELYNLIKPRREGI